MWSMSIRVHESVEDWTGEERSGAISTARDADRREHEGLGTFGVWYCTYMHCKTDILTFQMRLILYWHTRADDSNIALVST